ncbi:MAG: DUF6036 family nucleotidyltransferase [Thermoanaerobaculia bacterium]
MRQPVDAKRVRDFMRAFGREAGGDIRVYLTGGATAVLEGWRAATADIDLKIVPDSDWALQSMPALKEKLSVNVEIASPGDFIPELPGWQDRSRFIVVEGRASFFHYDFYAQALAKIERGHVKDLGDVREMFARHLIEAPRLRALFEEIEPRLFRYPSIDPKSFRRAVEEAAAGRKQ